MRVNVRKCRKERKRLVKTTQNPRLAYVPDFFFLLLRNAEMLHSIAVYRIFHQMRAEYTMHLKPVFMSC